MTATDKRRGLIESGGAWRGGGTDAAIRVWEIKA